MKLSITQVLDISKARATQAGQQLQDVLIYLSDFVTQVLQSLRNGLTYADNMNATVATVTLTHAVAQVVNSPNGKPVMIHHATQSTSTAITALIWYVNQQNQLTVMAKFDGNPTAAQTVVLIMVFG